MARIEIHRCDICGADDCPENRVSVRVTGIGRVPQSRTYRTMFEVVLTFGPPAEEPSESLDLCQRCGGGFIALLRERHQQREAAKAAVEKVKPAHGVLTFDDIGIAPIALADDDD